MFCPIEAFHAVDAPTLLMCHSLGRIGSLVVADTETTSSTSANLTCGLWESARAIACSLPCAAAGSSITWTLRPFSLRFDWAATPARTASKSASERPAAGATRIRPRTHAPPAERTIPSADGGGAFVSSRTGTTIPTGDDTAGDTVAMLVGFPGFIDARVRPWPSTG